SSGLIGFQCLEYFVCSSSSYRPRNSAGHSREAMTTAKIILLVEDDANDVLLIERSFRKAGLDHALKVVRDGEQATDYLSGRADCPERREIRQARDHHFLKLAAFSLPAVSM